jgi:titin
LLEDRLTPTTFTVVNTADAGLGSLRWAIHGANVTPGADVIAFDISGAGVHTITPLSALPAVTDRVAIKGQTQPGFAGIPLIELSGAGSSAKSGLLIEAGGSGSVVRSLVINQFENNGIRLRSDNCRVVGCFIGTDATGTVAEGNRHAVHLLPGSSGNVIGGTTAGARNVISGHLGVGVWIVGPGSDGNVVLGNFIGTDATGTASLHSGDGVTISNSQDNVVGGTTTSARNVISGNFHGVAIAGGSSGNRVEGNFIGTDVTGTTRIGNQIGVILVGASGNVIGGVVAGAGNVISGSITNGVQITAGTSGNRVEGNYIGTDATGTAPLGNSVGVIFKFGARDNVLGGTVAGARNVISGNTSYGMVFSGYGYGPSQTTGNAVMGNFIGTDVTGTAALGNSLSGVYFGPSGSDTLLTANVIGGTTAGARNVISGNGGHGVEITGDGTTGNVVTGNFIGTDVTGTAALGNAGDGVHFGVYPGQESGASGNVIGGRNAGAGNVISGNGGVGVSVESGAGNSVVGNRIFDNGGLGIDLGADGVTPNDLGDGDAGANDLINFPELFRARLTPDGLRVRGSLDTDPGQSLRIEFFASPAADPTGYGEGTRYLGFVTVSPGDYTFPDFFAALPGLGVEVGDVITATATDELGNTSEFSAALPVT